MTGDVLCLSHLRWSFVYQRPNHLMARCARERRVFFVEEPVFEGRTLRTEITQIEPGLHVVVPHLPSGISQAEVERLQRIVMDRLVSEARVREPLLWMYTPMALRFARHLRRSLTVYDCMDELTGFHGAPPALRELEGELFEVADLVFTGGQSLYEAKRTRHRHVHAFPSSVDAAHFAKAREVGGDEPADQRGIPRPRLGFFGVVDERMDLALLRAVAARRPDFHLMVLGPVAKIDAAQLPRLPNIHYLGMKKYDELPRYIAGWDVAIMPFALNDSTRYISPTKTLEYLAAGKPVVSTPIRDVVHPYGEQGLARIAHDATSFIEAVDAALAERETPESHARRDSCDAFVAQTSWDRTWARMHALVREAHTRRANVKAAAESHSETETREGPCSIT
jgi:UDP-galactopyranose mutase